MNLKYFRPTFFVQDYANAIPFNLFLVCPSMHLFVCLFCFALLISLIVSGSCYLEFCFTGNLKVMELAKID